MRKLTIILWILTGSIAVSAQYSIALLSPENVYLKPQLWNLSITNNSTTGREGYIQMSMKDISTNQLVLSATSNSFLISSGIQAVQQQTMEPITYTYSMNIPDMSPNGMLPAGQYLVCYQLFETYHGSTPLAENCEQIEVVPLSPPLLTIPENDSVFHADSVLQVLTPTFMWMPPTPLNMFANLNYNIIISEVLDGQSVTDAIQNNLPLQQADNLQQPFYSFSTTGVPLEKNKTYVWQVIAKDDQQFVAQSEVWSFKTQEEKDSSKSENNAYLLINESTNGIGVINSDTLHLKYVSSLTSPAMQLVFKDENGKVIYNVNRDAMQGDNYWNIPLPGMFKETMPFTVSITDENGKLYTLSFLIIKPDSN